MSQYILPYISDKTKKNVVLFVLYLCFCLSLRQNQFRYLRSNIHTLVLIIKILNIYTREFGALLT